MKARPSIDTDLSNPNDDGFVLGTAGRDEDPNAAASYGLHREHSEREMSLKDRRGLPGYPQPTQYDSEVHMTDQDLEREVLTRLLHAHPSGLGKEILDNYRGEKAVLDVIKRLEERNFIQGNPVAAEHQTSTLEFPVKLTSSGVEEAKRLDK